MKNFIRIAVAALAVFAGASAMSVSADAKMMKGHHAKCMMHKQHGKCPKMHGQMMKHQMMPMAKKY